MLMLVVLIDAFDMLSLENSTLAFGFVCVQKPSWYHYELEWNFVRLKQTRLSHLVFLTFNKKHPILFVPVNQKLSVSA